MRDFENERAVLSLILLDGALEDEPLNDGAGEAPQQIADGREFGAGRHDLLAGSRGCIRQRNPSGSASIYPRQPATILNPKPIYLS